MKEYYKAIFMGQVLSKSYYVEDYYNPPCIETSHQLIDTKIIEERTLSINVTFRDGETVFLSSVGERVYISDIVKSTDGSVIYYTSHITNFVDEEESKLSYEKAEQKLEEIKQERQEKSEKGFWKKFFRK